MFIELRASDGTNGIVFEVDEPMGQKVAVAKDPRGVVEASETIEGAVAQARHSAKHLLAAVQDLDVDAAEIKFGLKMAGEAGLFAITKVSGEAHCEITLSWSRPRTEPG